MLKEVLTERGSNYGPAIEHFNLTRDMYDLWERRFEKYNQRLPKDLRQMIKHVVYLNLDKLARASCNPMHNDNWVDIQGYAHLMESQINEENKR